MLRTAHEMCGRSQHSLHVAATVRKQSFAIFIVSLSILLQSAMNLTMNSPEYTTEASMCFHDVTVALQKCLFSLSTALPYRLCLFPLLSSSFC
uniref:Uncharacterized protein n=1 Tax=Rhipicephalus zambeziensis TaxID=60191 RepID=A0A224YCZ5_9ACAR